MNREEATALLRSGLGEAELKMVASFVAPIFWARPAPGGGVEIDNGSIFFLDCGDGCFGVTAAHVITGRGGYREATERDLRTVCQIYSEPFNPEERLIDLDDEVDVATFKVSRDEVRSFGRTVLTGHQSSWPPAPPQEGRGVLFAGFPGCERRLVGPREIDWGIYGACGIATSVSDRDVSCQFEREHWIDVMGKGLPPEGFKMGGVSGGPLLTIVEHKGIRSHRLAGVIYEGPHPDQEEDPATTFGLEVLRARRADFIFPDGMIDRSRWV